MSTITTNHALVILSVVLIVGIVLVVAVTLIEVTQRLTRISEGLGALGDALAGVESQHLRPLEPAVKAINAQFDVILSAMPGIARKASIVAARRPR
jgi:hypothetical protein